MMKRILLIGAFVCLAVSAHAQVLLKQSTATTVNGKLTKIADGTDHTGLAVTGITLKIIKHSDTLASTVTSVACAASGSSNDCVEIASSGVYNAELSTGNTDTLGRLDVCFLASGDYTDCTRFMVVDPASYNANVTGSLTSAAGIWAVATSTLTGAGTVGKEVVDALPSAVPGGAGGLPTVNASNHIVGVQADGITASSIAPAAIGSSEAPNLDAAISTRSTFAVKRSTAKVWPIQMFSSTTGLPMTTGTPVCTRRLDTGAFGGSLTETTVDADGFTFVSFASGDMAGTDSVTAKCTMAGARNSYAVFNIQAP